MQAVVDRLAKTPKGTGEIFSSLVTGLVVYLVVAAGTIAIPNVIRLGAGNTGTTEGLPALVLVVVGSIIFAGAYVLAVTLGLLWLDIQDKILKKRGILERKTRSVITLALFLIIVMPTAMVPLLFLFPGPRG